MEKLNLSLSTSELLVHDDISEILGCKKQINLQGVEDIKSILAEFVASYDIPELVDCVEGEFTADNVAITNNVSHAQFVLMGMLIDSYDTIIFPNFTDMYTIGRAEVCGYNTAVCEVTKDGFYKLAELKKAVTPKSIVYLSNPTSPFGMLYTKGRLSSIAELVKKRDAFIISNDSLNRLIYSGTYQHIGKFNRNSATIFSLSAMVDFDYDLAYVFAYDQLLAESLRAASVFSSGHPDRPKVSAYLAWMSYASKSDVFKIFKEGTW